MSLWSMAAGGVGAIDEWAGNFFNQHSSQSAQSYSAAVARDLGLMNQYFTAQNMEYSKILQSMLNSESFAHNKSLMQLQNELQSVLNESAFGYDTKLAFLSQLLNKKSADQDYKRSVKYIRDSLLKYKSALIEAGYNPLLALGSSAASYGGHTNGVSAGSVSGGSAGLNSVGSGSVSGGSPASSSGVGVVAAKANSPTISDNIHSAVELAKSASEIKANEARALSESSNASLNLERARTEANQRTDQGHKIQSETAKNYGSIASGIATGIGTAYGANKAVKVISKAAQAAKAGNIKAATKAAAAEIGSSANSAKIGSKIVGTVLPLAASAAVAAPTAKKGMQDAKKAVEKRNEDKNWYDKWRRIYFPMTGGF